MENLLYYPYINIPKSDWTIRTLLYYDRIGCIVPQRYFYEPDNYEPHMLNLVKNELVVPVNPIEVLDSPWEISEPFLEYVNSEEFNIEKRRICFQTGSIGKIHREKFKNGPRIHADKFDNEIFYQLQELGLAARDDCEWFYVEQKTANELMTFLSSIVAAKIKFRPTTDKIKPRFFIAGQPDKNYKVLKKERRKREIVLENLIPFPQEIDFKKLRTFKERHTDLLKRFKNQVELLVLDPKSNESSGYFEESIKELNFQKEELSSRMNESKLGNIFFGTICGTISAITGFAAGFGLAGVPGFANALHSALKIERAEDVIDQTGMKYLALVDKRLRKSAAKNDYK
jgi:hypothetical protein